MRFFLEDFAQPRLSEAESSHAIRVLRLRKGDAVTVLDGAGRKARGIIQDPSPKACTLLLDEIEETLPLWKGEIWLAIAPTKNADRTEWLVEKGTEIGLNGFVFIQTRYAERTRINQDRLEKVAVAAIKQSGQYFLPEIQAVKPFSEELLRPFDHLVLADLDSNGKPWKRNPSGKTLLLVGPEGDFSAEERNLLVSKGATSIRLGPTVLRTETAGLYSLILAHQ